ncbi:hypothetical protein COEREDRAFT_82792 [Coemansia reversa NRRL 1564]|uniref:Uncharacterized protein n=1 Tax=Coemansia reversa (strain ATCC 12441 / NRRL 1564) TaxID=763665 RepID=A0A2G5B5V6_COERN|nr:hypothetical protein COEREDRAFT_82792 [Coemansia reversa NRRL 1564]|eukprot:PIA14396.1 hypothetical protein COEREDRAFT_82792 [Coemansia reversa NRRL 1564]
MLEEKEEASTGASEDAVLSTLKKAQSYAESSDDRVKLVLASELRAHYLSEKTRYEGKQQHYQQQLERAQYQYTQGLKSRTRDMERLRKLVLSQNSLSQRLSTGKRAQAQEQLKFSEMMVENAHAAIEMSRSELGEANKALEENVARLRGESSLALKACEGVLRRVPGLELPESPRQPSSGSIQQETRKVPPSRRLPLPPPPPPPPPPPTIIRPQHPMANGQQSSHALHSGRRQRQPLPFTSEPPVILSSPQQSQSQAGRTQQQTQEIPNNTQLKLVQDFNNVQTSDNFNNAKTIARIPSVRMPDPLNYASQPAKHPEISSLSPQGNSSWPITQPPLPQRDVGRLQQKNDKPLRLSAATMTPPPLPDRQAGKLPDFHDQSVMPANKAANRRRWLVIVCEDAQQRTAVEMLQRRFYARVSRSSLVALQRSSGDESSVRRLVFEQLWPGLRRMLMGCLPGVAQADLSEGLAGFGADAYLELRSHDYAQQQTPVLMRVPLSIVGAELCAPTDAADGGNAAAMEQCFGLSTAAASAEGAVRRVVQLISTESLARNAGILATPTGLVIVRRIAVQNALISPVLFYSCPPTMPWCHPIIALGCFVAELLAAGPVHVLEPPRLS